MKRLLDKVVGIPMALVIYFPVLLRVGYGLANCCCGQGLYKIRDDLDVLNITLPYHLQICLHYDYFTIVTENFMVMCSRHYGVQLINTFAFDDVIAGCGTTMRDKWNSYSGQGNSIFVSKVS